MQLTWIKCTGDSWCSLFNVDLNNAHFNNLEGIYVIWHGGSNAKTVRVGKGNIRNRITAHREDPDILKYKDLGLFVTWAKVDSANKDGVEKFLANKLSPLVGETPSFAGEVQVNIPW